MTVFTRIRLAPTTPSEPVPAKTCEFGLCDGYGLIEAENKAWKPGLRLLPCPCTK